MTLKSSFNGTCTCTAPDKIVAGASVEVTADDGKNLKKEPIPLRDCVYVGSNTKIPGIFVFESIYGVLRLKPHYCHICPN